MNAIGVSKETLHISSDSNSDQSSDENIVIEDESSIDETDDNDENEEGDKCDGTESGFITTNKHNISQNTTNKYVRKATNVYGKKSDIIVFSVENVLKQDPNARRIGLQFNLSFRCAKGDNKIIKTILCAHGFKETGEMSTEYNILWTGGHIRPHTLRSFQDFQRVNHFPRSNELTRKDRLFKNVQRMQTLRGLKHFDFIPPSFLIPGEYADLCQYAARDKGPLIVKPVALSRGRGIFLCSNPSQIPLDESLIVSRYISNPYLIGGLKFDLRVYVLVSSFEPLVAYLYEEGLARFATEKYQNTTKHLKTQCMHLTNYSVNKRNENFVHNEDADVEDFGNKWSLGALLRYLKSQNVDTACLMMKIEDIVIKSLISVEPYISSASRMFQPFRGNCFELFGYDIIIDENLRPWLLEVNLSPSLACDSPLDFKVKSHMLADMFNLIGVGCQNPAQQHTGIPPWVTRPFSNYFRSFSKRTMSTGPRVASASSTGSSTNLTNKQIRRPSAGLRHVNSTGLSTQKTKSATNIPGYCIKPQNTKNDEISRILNRVKEENDRKGGWVRIFPTEQSLDMYGAFLGASASPSSCFENSGNASSGISNIYGNGSIGGSINRILHIRLFPNKYFDKESSDNSYNLNGSRPTSATVYNKRKSTYQVYTATKERLPFYERKLGEESPNYQTETHLNKKENCNIISDSKKITDKKLIDTNIDNKIYNSDSSDASSSSQAEIYNLSPSCDKDIEEIIENGDKLSIPEARLAFGQYLIRVRSRLILESTNDDDDDDDNNDCFKDSSNNKQIVGHEQVDLIIRFLKRANNNNIDSSIDKSSYFNWKDVPNKNENNLKIRQRCLAKILGNFITYYTNSTINFKSNQIINSFPNFNNLIIKASEQQLEALLSSYTRKHKSAGIFLNASYNYDEQNEIKHKQMFDKKGDIYNEDVRITKLNEDIKKSKDLNKEKSYQNSQYIISSKFSNNETDILKTEYLSNGFQNSNNIHNLSSSISNNAFLKSESNDVKVPHHVNDHNRSQTITNAISRLDKSVSLPYKQGHITNHQNTKPLTSPSTNSSLLYRSSSLTNLSSNQSKTNLNESIESLTTNNEIPRNNYRPLTGATKLGYITRSKMTSKDIKTENNSKKNDINTVKSPSNSNIPNKEWNPSSISQALERLAQEHRTRRLTASSMGSILNQSNKKEQNNSNESSKQLQKNKSPNPSKPPIFQSNRVPFTIKRF